MCHSHNVSSFCQELKFAGTEVFKNIFKTCGSEYQKYQTPFSSQSCQRNRLGFVSYMTNFFSSFCFLGFFSCALWDCDYTLYNSLLILYSLLAENSIMSCWIMISKISLPAFHFQCTIAVESEAGHAIPILQPQSRV